jgi:hypothetical protein
LARSGASRLAKAAELGIDIVDKEELAGRLKAIRVFV